MTHLEVTDEQRPAAGRPLTEHPQSVLLNSPSQALRAPSRRAVKGVWLWLLAVMVLFGGLAVWWYVTSVPTRQSVPATAAVVRGDIEKTVLATGTLEAKSLVSVGAQVSGTVKSVDVTLGQAVKAGDLVAKIDALSQENAVKSAEASLASIKAQRAAQAANVEQTRKALDRADRMLEKAVVSDSDYDAALAAYESGAAQLTALDAQIQQAELNVDSAKLNLEHTTITAPVAGTVVAILVDKGQTVSAAQTAPTIIKIADLDTMLIKAEISEADVTRVRSGQRVYFSILGEPDTRIDARLLSLEPAPTSIASETSTTSSSEAVYYNGIFEVPNPDRRLRISMTAQVTIVIAEASDVLLVPSAAIRTGADGKHHVAVYDPNTKTTASRLVEIGIDNKVSAEIRSGLAEGELAVTPGGTTAPVSTSTNSNAGRGILGPLARGL